MFNAPQAEENLNVKIEMYLDKTKFFLIFHDWL